MAGQAFACVKIIGRANVAASVDFKTLTEELRQKGYHFFVLDLSECVLMDSTFLGVLAGFGLKMAHGQPGEHTPPIELLNPNARITELLESLGVLHLFTVAHHAPATPDSCEAREIAPTCKGKEEVTRACLEAHQTLMAIDPKNIPKFKDVTAFLAEDLKRLKP